MVSRFARRRCSLIGLRLFWVKLILACCHHYCGWAAIAQSTHLSENRAENGSSYGKFSGRCAEVRNVRAFSKPARSAVVEGVYLRVLSVRGFAARCAGGL